MQQQHIQDMHIMLINYYKYNSLQINRNKTEFIVMDRHSLVNNVNIEDKKQNIIYAAKTMKILCITINPENNMSAYLANMMTKSH